MKFERAQLEIEKMLADAKSYTDHEKALASLRVAYQHVRALLVQERDIQIAESLFVHLQNMIMADVYLSQKAQEMMEDDGAQ